MRGWALALLLLTGSPQAQVTNYPIHTYVDGGPVQLLAVQVRCPSPTGKGSGLGFARIELENVSQQALDLHVSTRQGYSTGGFEASHRETLERGATARLCLPVMGERTDLRVEVADQVNHNSIGSGGSLNGVAVLHVGTQAAALDWKTLLEAELLPSGTPAAVLSARAGHGGTQPLPTVTADDLPPDPRWLSGYDLILVDAAAPGLSGEIQERLVQYVAGGGALLVYQGEALAPGPLASMADTTTPGRHGLGSWLRIEGSSDAALEQKLRPWLRHPTVGPMLASGLPQGAPVRSGLHGVLRIPGLGEVPVWAFLLLIAGFVGFVVRQLLGVLRKRVRPMRMLLVLPVTGVSFALLILGYGLFSEGFAIRGIMWSFTRLDQRNHTAAGVATRTLYAGLSPSELVPSPDTLLLCSALQYRGGQAPALRLDMDRGGRVANTILPSRTMTGLVTTTVGRARERLRFRRRPGGLEILAGPELRPCATAQAVVLRDFAGRTYVQSAPGQLTPVADPPGERLTAAHESLERMEFLSRSRTRRHGPTPPAGGTRFWTTDWLEGQIGDQLAPGTYLAWVEAPPAFDSLGLEVEYRGSVHLVLGILAPEDILE